MFNKTNFCFSEVLEKETKQYSVKGGNIFL